MIMVQIFDANEVNCMVSDYMLWHQFGSHYFISWKNKNKKKEKTPAGGCAINVAVWPSDSIC